MPGNEPLSSNRPDSIYDSDFVRGLFDEMSQSYGLVNVVSSFGFCSLWRRQCVDQIRMSDANVVVDLMSGMGELNGLVAARTPGDVVITGYDISPEMGKRATTSWHGKPIDASNIVVDVLEHDFAPNSADVVVSCFGLKTFSDQQQQILAQQVFRMLKPGGKFAFLEISIPPTRILRWPYQFYLNHVIPIIGRLLMGNPDNYRLLGIYTKEFESCQRVAETFRHCGLKTETSRFFFGCATGIFGSKPIND